MSASSDRAWELVPTGVSAVAGAVAIGYVWIMVAQGDSPQIWFLGGLLAAAALAAYAGVRSVPRRAEAIAVSGAILIFFGILGIFSVGLPIFIAGAIALASAGKTREERRNQ